MADDPGEPWGRTVAGEAVLDIPVEDALRNCGLPSVPIAHGVDRLVEVDLQQVGKAFSRGAIRTYYRIPEGVLACQPHGPLGIKIQFGIGTRRLLLRTAAEAGLQGQCVSVPGGNLREYSLARDRFYHQLVAQGFAPKIFGAAVAVFQATPAVSTGTLELHSVPPGSYTVDMFFATLLGTPLQADNILRHIFPAKEAAWEDQTLAMQLWAALDNEVCTLRCVLTTLVVEHVQGRQMHSLPWFVNLPNVRAWFGLAVCKAWTMPRGLSH